MTVARSFTLQGTVLPLSAEALDRLAAVGSPPTPDESRAEVGALLAVDLPDGYSAVAFEALPRGRKRLLMVAVHRAALAGLDRYP